MDESGYRLEICQRHELCLHQLKHLLKKVCVRCFYQSSIESYYTKTQSTQINQHLSCTLPQTTHLGSQPETTTGTQKEQTMQDILKTLTPREHWQAVALGRQAGGHHRSIKELLNERPQRVNRGGLASACDNMVFRQYNLWQVWCELVRQTESGGPNQ